MAVRPMGISNRDDLLMVIVSSPWYIQNTSLITQYFLIHFTIKLANDDAFLIFINNVKTEISRHEYVVSQQEQRELEAPPTDSLRRDIR